MMKYSLFLIGVLFAFNVFASRNDFLTCELFENGASVRLEATALDEGGQATIDMGQIDIYYFFGFGGIDHDGMRNVGVGYSIEADSQKTYTELSESISVTSSTGSTLTLTCSMED